MTKQPYEPPTITDLGAAASLTRGTGGEGRDQNNRGRRNGSGGGNNNNNNNND
jgi:hypothetical protein